MSEDLEVKINTAFCRLLGWKNEHNLDGASTPWFFFLIPTKHAESLGISRNCYHIDDIYFASSKDWLSFVIRKFPSTRKLSKVKKWHDYETQEIALAILDKLSKRYPLARIGRKYWWKDA